MTHFYDTRKHASLTNHPELQFLLLSHLGNVVGSQITPVCAHLSPLIRHSSDQKAGQHKCWTEQEASTKMKWGKQNADCYSESFAFFDPMKNQFMLCC